MVEYVKSTPWTLVSDLPGYEWRLNESGHRETRPVEPTSPSTNSYEGAAWNAMHEECSKIDVMKMWMDQWTKIQQLKARIEELEIAVERYRGF